MKHISYGKTRSEVNFLNSETPMHCKVMPEFSEDAELVAEGLESPCFGLLDNSSPLHRVRWDSDVITWAVVVYLHSRFISL